jgi:hypothetical protein
MKTRKIVGLVLLVLGILSLVYGGFTRVKDTHHIDLGPIHVEARDEERVNIPAWAGGATVVVGGILLIL